MRFSPTKLLHGMLYTAPVILLTLAACGGGGGGGSSTPPLDVYYTVSGTTSGLTSSGLTLRNNGGDDLTVPSGFTSFTFPAINTSYNVTVLTHPSSPSQLCTVGNASGPRQSVNVTNVTVSCVDAFLIGGSISGVLGTGLVLQNNGGDNLQVDAGAGSYAFSTPLATSAVYAVTIISQPNGQDCSFSYPSSGDASSGVVATQNVVVDIDCSNSPAALPEDLHVYTADFGANTVSAYQATSGALAAPTTATAGAAPTSITVDPAGKFAYVTNQNANTISAFSIGGGGVLTPLADVDAGTTGVQPSIATGSTPVTIAIHPSGKFAYVVNKIINRISAYSIDTDPNSITFGALARIDADGGIAGNQTTIPTRLTPVAIAIHPDGGYAYVANADDNSVSVYSIDPVGGALTAIDADGLTNGAGPTYMSTSGTTPYSLKVDPAGQYLYVANRASNNVSIFAISATVDPGTLTLPTVQTVTNGGATTPISIALHPSKQFAYVVNSGNSTVNVYSTATAGWGINLSSGPTGNLPTSISIDRSGQYAYVANSGDSTISAYSIDPATGMLTEVIGSPFTAGTTPYSVTTAP